MKAALFLLALLISVALGGTAPALSRSLDVGGLYTLYNLDLLTAYLFDVSDPADPILPPVDEEQLCFLVGAISGCSGCQHGTQNLCAWVGYDFIQNPLLPFELPQCIPRTSAEDLVAKEIVTNLSHICPSNPHDEPVLNEYQVTFESGTPGVRPLPVLSESWSTYHDMIFGSVGNESASWAVDRTALWSDLGIIKTGGYRLSLFLAAGDFNRPTVTCATLNDPTALDTLYGATGTCGINNHRLIDELVEGLLTTQNDAFCAKAIFGAYLSTRCPEYGRAISGISLSLYRRLFFNCLPAPTRQVFIGPSVVNLGGGIEIPFNILGLPIVPDGTPFALDDIPIEPSEQFEDYLGIDEVSVDRQSGEFFPDGFLNAANIFLGCVE